jgi:hypothetical protein
MNHYAELMIISGMISGSVSVILIVAGIYSL